MASCGFPDHKKRQIPFLGPLEWMNLFGPSNKVVYLKKLVFQSGVCFLIRCIFEHASAIWWIYEKTERGKYFLSNGNFFLISKWRQKSMNWKTMFKIAICFKFYALCSLNFMFKPKNHYFQFFI